MRFYSGSPRKLLKLDDLQNMHDQLMNILPFKKLFVCVHDDEDNCSCRKPKPGMILEAISTNNLQYNECIMIGDSIKDIQSANSAGISSLLLDTNYNTHIIFNNKIQSLISLI